MMVILSGTRRMRYAAILAKIIVVALVFALMWIAMPAGVAVGETYKGVDFPLGDKSFADMVGKFNPGKGTASPYNNPQNAIGPPDCPTGKKDCFVALGHDGNLTVKFTDNYLIDVAGPDLYVFEIGGMTEPFKVEISKDGLTWINLGIVKGQPTSLDIHNEVAIGDKFSYVRLTDAGGGSGHPFAAADIDAVGAIGAEEKLFRVEIEQVPKHVVKDVPAKFIAHAYENKEIPPDDLTYEWYIDSADNLVGTDSQTLEYKFDALGSYKVYCRVTYGSEYKWGKLDVNVEPFTIEFKPSTKFSPMDGESAVVEFQVNTLARVCFDDVVIHKVYYPRWYFDDRVDIDEEMTVYPDQWYKVKIWDGRINNGRPAINGPYLVELRAKPTPWWFFEDKACNVRVYDDPGKFVSIESVHRPLRSRGHSSTQGYAQIGECGEWSVMITKVLGSLGAGGVVTWCIPAAWPPVTGFLVGSVLVGCGMELYTFFDLDYTARYDYFSETLSLSPCVTDINRKYGPILDYKVIIMRNYVLSSVLFTGPTRAQMTEKRDGVGALCITRGPAKYVDQSTIKEVTDSEYKCIIKGTERICYPGTLHEIKDAQIYGKETIKGREYRELVLKVYKRSKWVNVWPESRQQSESMTAAGLGYGSETIDDFRPISTLGKSHISAQSQPSEFTDSFSDHGTDTNGDGLYDTLTILAGVDVEVAGIYIVQAGLFDNSGAPIVWSGNYSYSEPGTHDITLDFNGITIYRHGEAGPYNLKYIRLYDEDLTLTDEMINAHVTSAYNYADFQVPPANFSGIYSDQGTDTDGDGLFDYLSVSVGVTVQNAGDYTIIGNLVDSRGEPITWANQTSSLDTGSHTLNLNFDGVAIRQHPLPGPYNLSVVLTSDGTLVHSLADAYTTASYSQDDFQPAPAQFNSVFSDYGSDTDSDGQYNYLTLSAGVDVFMAGSYTATGYLYDENEKLITWASNTNFWDTGSKTLCLDFDGVNIRQHAVNGAYAVSIVLAKEETPEEDLSYARYATSAYDYADFQGPPDDFRGNFSDYGKDMDDDGFFNYLALSTEMTISNAGDYGIVGNLYDKDGELITWASDYAELGVGSQSLVLYFDGFAISRHAVDGPYDVSLALLRDGNPEEILSSSSYTTSAYNHTDFQAAQPPIASFTYSPLNPVVNEIITFDATPSYDSDGIIVNYEWAFGDGFNKTGEVVTHAYTSSGNYNVILTVTDNDGAVGTETKGITVSGAKTIYVDDDFTDDPANHKWDTIQEGITDANDGDTVLVYNGTYTETVTLNKTLTLTGEEMPKIDAHGSGDAIHVTADNCTVKGFCCVNAQPSPYAGIRVDSSNNVIEENNCRDNYDGIYLSGTSNEIRNNIANYNDHHGIKLGVSSENIIANNTAKNNGNDGIYLIASDNNRITDNVAANNNNSGIYLHFSDNNEIRNNYANDNHNNGTKLWFSDENVVANNTAKNNGDSGIYLAFSDGNRITDNEASSNVNDGMMLSSSDANNIVHNIAKDNGNKGIFLSSSSSDNTIYLNNFVDNLDNAFSFGYSFGSSNTTWHSPSTMTYTYSGNTYSSHLGNYWSDYKGSDTDGDGIGDSSYSIDGDEDICPLIKPWENYFALQVNGPPHNPTPTPECKVQITSDPSDTDRPSIVYANGFYYVAYQSLEKNYGIYIKKFDYQWNFKKKVEVVSGSAYYDSPSLAFANNKLYVAYISNAEGANKNDYDVIVKEYNPNSFACTSGEKYLTTLQSCQDLPALYYKDGYFYLAYQSWETGNGDIYIKKFDSNWNQLKKVRVTSKSSLQDRPSIAYADGYFYVAYFSEEADNRDIFVKRLNSNLNLDVFKKQITFETSRQIYPSIAFVNNQFALAYASSETGTWGIYMKRYDNNWNYIGKTKVIDDNSAHERRPSIIYAQNDLWIAYVRYLEESDNWYTFVIIPGCV